jgi:hypothetical protein
MAETNPAANRPLATGVLRIGRAAICALVFLASGSIVYWAAARQTRAPEIFRATATLVEHFPTAAGPNAADSIPGADSIAAFRPDPEAIRRQVLSDASLRGMAASARSGNGDGHALPGPTSGRCPPDQPSVGARCFAQKATVPFSPSTPADPEPIRRRLRFSSQAAEPGSRILSIEYTDSHRDQALRLVNELAGRYADAYRAAVAAMLGKADEQAAQAVQQSRKQWQQAEAQRSEFLRHPPPVQRHTQTPKTAPPPAKPRWVDNPRWADLQRAHDNLLRRRQELLETRTPLHPEVLVVDDLIAQSEAKMAAVPRRLLVGSADAQTHGRGDTGTRGRGDAGTRLRAIPGLSSSADSTVGQSKRGSAGATADGSSGKERVQWEKRRLALDAAVQQARAQLDQAVRAERTNRNALGRAATIDLHPADRCEVVTAGVPIPWRFLPLALASGLGLATAAGMFFTGLSIDPLVTSTGQLQRWLPGPLLGPVPIPFPAGGDGEPAVPEASSVLALNAKGAILLVVCILALAFAFASS